MTRTQWSLRLRHAPAVFAILAVSSLTGAGCEDPASDPVADTVETQCTATCTGRVCGPDGCGGSCGTCEGTAACVLGLCQTTGQADTSEPPRTPQPGEDFDADGVEDIRDNCPVYNPDQADMDRDRRGDACDDDIDGDGFDNALDCGPGNPFVSPGSPERCGDGIDNNCNNMNDEENAANCVEFYIDGDGDGAGISTSRRCLCGPTGDHRVRVGGDCDDESAALSPLVAEVCDDIDNNCNLLVDDGCDDDGDDYCDAGMTIIGTPAVCPKGGNDCNDYWASISPEAAEVEADGFDNNCDGIFVGDEGPPIVADCPAVCTGTNIDSILCATGICYPNNVLNASIVSPTNTGLFGRHNAISRWGNANNDLAPREGNSYAILGTGSYTSSNHDAGIGSIIGGVPDPYSAGDTMYDAVEMRLIMRAPNGATGFSLDYIFLSAEYEEFIGSPFNDRFYIILKAPETTGDASQIINFTRCLNPNTYFDFEQDGDKFCYIAVNTAFSEGCPNAPTDIRGTNHECAPTAFSAGGSSTGWLGTSWPIQSGEQFELIFHIHDTADNAYNSQVILDNFRWEGGTFESGTISHSGN